MGRLLDRLLSAQKSEAAAIPAILRVCEPQSQVAPARIAESQESHVGSIPAERLPAVVEPAATDAQGVRLLSAIRRGGLPDELLGRDDADPATLAGMSADELAAYARAMHATAEREAGRVPDGYTVAAHCEACGPVWLFPGAEHVIACPWCWNRRAKKPIPRPPVTCGTCAHFIADPINPPAGCGACALGVEYGNGEHGRHPFTERRCPHHRLGEQADG